MIRTHIFRHPQIGLIIVDASVERFEWNKISCGRVFAFVDANKQHPHRVAAAIYDVNYPIYESNIMEHNVLSGQQIADWLTQQAKIASASKLLGFEGE